MDNWIECPECDGGRNPGWGTCPTCQGRLVVRVGSNPTIRNQSFPRAGSVDTDAALRRREQARERLEKFRDTQNWGGV